MPSYRAAWLIGSRDDLPQQGVHINASAQSTPAGSFYLHDASAARSLLMQFRDAVILATGGATTVVLQQDGRVRIDCTVLFSLTWGSSTLLRDLLGFDANLALLSTYTAPNISPLLWMPGKPETPMAQRLGVVGHRTHNVYQTTAPYSGKSESVSHGYRTYARYTFPMIDTERLTGADGVGGTYETWHEEVAVRSARWKLYRDVLEDPGGTASTVFSLTQPLGPYVVTGPRLAWKWDLSRGFERTDKRGDIDIACHVVPEIT